MSIISTKHDYEGITSHFVDTRYNIISYTNYMILIVISCIQCDCECTNNTTDILNPVSRHNASSYYNGYNIITSTFTSSMYSVIQYYTVFW